MNEARDRLAGMTPQHDPAFGVGSHMEIVVVGRETRHINMHALCKLLCMQREFDGLGVMQTGMSAQTYVTFGLTAQAFRKKESLCKHGTVRIFQRRRHGVTGRWPEAIRMVQVQEVFKKIET